MATSERRSIEATKLRMEEQLISLGYVERLSDIDGQRHYRVELPIDKLLEEDKICTGAIIFNLSNSKLTILNEDGLHPKLASDLDTFNNGFIEIKKSPIAGYGIFAAHDLERRTPILIERALIDTNCLNLYKKLDTLTEEQRRAYQNLHSHKITVSEDSRAAIWRTNRFSVGHGGSVFLVASRFNHACNNRSNVDYSYDPMKNCMVFVTNKKVTAGSELFIRYGGGPQHLLINWGFRCTCGGCKGVPEDTSETIDEFSAWAS